MFCYYFSVKLFKQEKHCVSTKNLGLCIVSSSREAAEDLAERELIASGYSFDCYELFCTDIVKEVF